MRIHSALLALSFLSAHAQAGSNVEITEVGIKGYYSAVTPTPVAVDMSVPAGVRAISLDFTITFDVKRNLGLSRVDHFHQNAAVEPGDRAHIVAPLLILGWGNRASLQVKVSDSSRREIGSSVVDLNSLRQSGETLIAVICKDHNICDEAQSQISFSGSEEDVSTKEKSFKFVTLPAPRQQWLDYAVASVVVVAGPISSWTTQQRFALEAYARRGGTLILLEKECAAPEFLTVYRTASAKAPSIVGKGRLFFVPSLESKELGDLFSGKNLKANSAVPEYIYAPMFDAVRRAVAVSFSFPRLRWFMLWLAIYILIAGLGNFSVLRHFRRLEWGWLTTPIIAVLFAAALYFVSSANRPKHVTLDDVAVYCMDDKSPDAWESVGLRVSSPERQQLSVSVGDDAVLISRQPVNTSSSNADIALEITGQDRAQPGWQVEIGPPITVGLSMFRWSLADLDFETFHRFPGTVTIDKNLRLANGTGQEFREAMYLDFPANKRYQLGAVGPGQQVDLTRVAEESTYSQLSAGDFTFQHNAPPESQYVAPQVPSRRNGIVHLKDLPYSAYWFRGLNRAFVGLSDGPVPDATVTGSNFAKNNFSLTVVAIDQP